MGLLSVASSVMFVRHLEPSVAFYHDVLGCEVAIHDRDAALLIACGGFQMYLIARGDRIVHTSDSVGLQYLTWVTDSATTLERMSQTLRSQGYHTENFVSGGVRFVESRDPDGIRLLLAYPTPETLPRSVVGPRLYT